MLALLLASGDASAARKKQHNLSSVKKEQKATQRAIKLTAEQIEANAKKTGRTLSALNALNAEITQQSRSITEIAGQIDSIDASIAVISDSIRILDERLEAMRASYANSIKSMHKANSGSMSALAFIFASDSFTQAYRRVRYLREFAAWKDKKSTEIKEAQAQLDGQRKHYAALQADKSAAMAKMTSTKADLEKKQKETSVLVAQLKKEGASLKKVLKEKEAQARALDAELDRLIAEEQRRQEAERRKAEEARRKQQEKQLAQGKAKGEKTKETEAKGSAPKPAPKPKASSSAANYATAEADRKLTGSFESNKGRLLFPVSGKYKIVRPFGRHKHPDLPHVVTDNSGIDIEVPPGGNARAVFGGTVSAIFRQPGFNTIVMVRHGSYLTIYANLTDILVKKGDVLKQGQTLGRIYSDPDDDNRSILHFELRKETQKLNPSAWVR
ncbi:MAG: peptidoglycan DD-metalloendopeptidase family protein [Muribaculum sp.]